jgi:protein-S-isoprenylcysteine O-methyltransferase Ste14
MPLRGSSAHARLDAPVQTPLVRLGGWLFKQRSWLPIPIVITLVALPMSVRHPLALWGGVAFVALGQGVRLWAVHHIGVISRTRSERLGPLVSTGPFSHVRNPLYLGNIALWLGFTFSAGLPWLAPIVLIVLAVEYHAIVRWEEGLLTSRLGDSYRAYLTRVPRWIPTLRGNIRPVVITEGYSWRDTFFSERSTLAAVVIGYLVLWLKA